MIFYKFKNWFSSLKLKHKVRNLFLFIIGIYLIIFFSIYATFIKRDMINYSLENNFNTLISIVNNLNSELETIDNMSQLIMTNKEVIKYLKGTDNQKILYTKNVKNAVNEITNVFNYISSVFIIRPNGEYINNSRGITKIDRNIILSEEWYNKIAKEAGGVVISINGDGAFTSESGKTLISLIRIVNDLETQKPIGMIAVNLSTDILDNSYKDMSGPNKQFYYFDNKGVYLGKKNLNKEIEELTFNADNYKQLVINNQKIISYYKVPDTPFIISSYEKVSFGELFSDQAFNIFMVFLFVTIGALVLIGIVITKYITHPIERLVQSMNSVKTGWLRRLSLSLPNDEIGDLKNSYNEMLVEINQLINKLVEKEKSIQKAELDALQEQIKPHFLYNTIDTIGYLALTDSSEKVYDALETLGNFYRKFLSKGSKEITLKDEINIVKDYLKLQKLRYGDIFEDKYNLDNNLLDIYVPKLILQPLVENSLYHGIRLKGEKGIIRISTFSDGKYIYIVVYDSGIGMSEKQINSIMNSKNSKSFGFKGTIERIQYFCNEDDVYEIKSKEGEFTEIKIKIPISGGK